MNDNKGIKFDHSSRLQYIRNLKIRIDKIKKAKKERDKNTEEKNSKKKRAHYEYIKTVALEPKAKDNQPPKKEDKNIPKNIHLPNSQTTQRKDYTVEYIKPKKETQRENKPKEIQITTKQTIKEVKSKPISVKPKAPIRKIEILTPKEKTKEKSEEEKIKEIKSKEEKKSGNKGTIGYFEDPNLTNNEIVRNSAIVKHINDTLNEMYLQLKELEWKRKLIENDFDSPTYTKEEIEKIQKRIEELLKTVERLMYELNYYGYEFDQNYLRSIGIELVSKISNREQIGDLKYIGVYRKLLEDIDRYKAKVDEMEKEADERIILVNERDKSYEEYLKQEYDVNKMNDDINNLVKYQEKFIKHFYSVMKTTTETETRLRMVRDGMNVGIVRAYLTMRALQRLGGSNSLIARAATLAATTNFLHMLFSPTYHEELQEVQVTREEYEERQYFTQDLGDAKVMIEESREKLKEMKKQLKEFESHPEYKEILARFDKMEYFLDNTEYEIQNIETKVIEDKPLKLVREYNNAA